MKDNLVLNSKAILDTSTEIECPNKDCDSHLFFPTMKVRKVSALMTGTGQPGIIPVSGPMLCVKCQRELVDADFGYTAQDEPVEEKKDEENSG